MDKRGLGMRGKCGRWSMLASRTGPTQRVATTQPTRPAAPTFERALRLLLPPSSMTRRRDLRLLPTRHRY